LGNLSRRKSKRAAGERAGSYRPRRSPSSKWVIRTRLQDLAMWLLAEFARRSVSGNRWNDLCPSSPVRATAGHPPSRGLTG